MKPLNKLLVLAILIAGLNSISSHARAECKDTFLLTDIPTRFTQVGTLNIPTRGNTNPLLVTVYDVEPTSTPPSYIGTSSTGLVCNFNTDMRVRLQTMFSTENPRALRDKLDVIKDGGLTTGYLYRAWYSNPTERYPHGALGDTIEAQTLNLEIPFLEQTVSAVEGRKKVDKVIRYTIPDDEVFEDLHPRLFWPPVSPGRAGLVRGMRTSPKVAAIVSSLSQGASVAIFELQISGQSNKDLLQPLHKAGEEKPGIYGFAETPKLVKIAQTPFIGTSYRWLNIIGIGDFDGDGMNEIAFVVTPHIGGRLEIWELRDGKLVKEAEMDGFTNHINGSPVQDMSAIGDYNADGVADLAIPDFSRKSIRLMSFARGQLRQIKILSLPARITTNIVPLQSLKEPEGSPAPHGLMMGLENKSIVVLPP